MALASTCSSTKEAGRLHGHYCLCVNTAESCGVGGRTVYTLLCWVGRGARGKDVIVVLSVVVGDLLSE